MPNFNFPKKNKTIKVKNPLLPITTIKDKYSRMDINLSLLDKNSLINKLNTYYILSKVNDNDLSVLLLNADISIEKIVDSNLLFDKLSSNALLNYLDIKFINNPNINEEVCKKVIKKAYNIDDNIIKKIDSIFIMRKEI